MNSIMNMSLIKTISFASLFSGVILFSSCQSSSYTLSSVEGESIVVDHRYDATPNIEAEKILLTYKNRVDSIMSPVIGYSLIDMSAQRPESTLSNLVADILRQSTTTYIGKQADVAVINMGGLRASLPKGDVKYGNIFEITPFENTLCIIKMSGKDMKELFQNIASVRGEGLSGAQLVVSKEGKLISATIGGVDIDDNKMYNVATVDYLAEGNDNMVTFKKITDKVQPDGATLRQIFLDYVKAMSAQGKKLDSKVEGRIVIK